MNRRTVFLNCLKMNQDTQLTDQQLWQILQVFSESSENYNLNQIISNYQQFIEHSDDIVQLSFYRLQNQLNVKEHQKIISLLLPTTRVPINLDQIQFLAYFFVYESDYVRMIYCIIQLSESTYVAAEVLCFEKILDDLLNKCQFFTSNDLLLSVLQFPQVMYLKYSNQFIEIAQRYVQRSTPHIYNQLITILIECMETDIPLELDSFQKLCHTVGSVIQFLCLKIGDPDFDHHLFQFDSLYLIVEQASKFMQCGETVIDYAVHQLPTFACIYAFATSILQKYEVSLVLLKLNIIDASQLVLLLLSKIQELHVWLLNANESEALQMSIQMNQFVVLNNVIERSQIISLEFLRTMRSYLQSQNQQLVNVAVDFLDMTLDSIRSFLEDNYLTDFGDEETFHIQLIGDLELRRFQQAQMQKRFQEIGGILDRKFFDSLITANLNAERAAKRDKIVSELSVLLN